MWTIWAALEDVIRALYLAGEDREILERRKPLKGVLIALYELGREVRVMMHSLAHERNMTKMTDELALLLKAEGSAPVEETQKAFCLLLERWGYGEIVLRGEWRVHLSKTARLVGERPAAGRRPVHSMERMRGSVERAAHIVGGLTGITGHKVEKNRADMNRTDDDVRYFLGDQDRVAEIQSLLTQVYGYSAEDAATAASLSSKNSESKFRTELESLGFRLRYAGVGHSSDPAVTGKRRSGKM
jgi:hypothetical protein